MPQLMIVNYVNGKRDVFRLDDNFHPVDFVKDGLLNVLGSYSSLGPCQWYYIPLVSIQNYTKQRGEVA